MQNERVIKPAEARYISIEQNRIDDILSVVSKPWATEQNSTRLLLPLVAGDVEFIIKSLEILPKKLSEKYPGIKTFYGNSVDGKHTVFLDLTYQGFHAAIQSPDGMQYIDPLSHPATDLYQIYRKSDLNITEEEAAAYRCDLDEYPEYAQIDEAYIENQDIPISVIRGEALERRTWKVAIACTAEYTSYHGGTAELGLSAITTALVRINQIIRNEIGGHLILHEDNDKLVFLDAATDGYTNGNTGAMINENPTIINANISPNSFDYGHVFGTNAGGLAQLRSVCAPGSQRSRGVTCHGNPIGDGFYVDYVCHEMGHQFGANHTFNNCGGGNENAGTAYEPGSGSTIMSYSGLCGSNNIQFFSGPYYHASSLEEIFTHTRLSGANNCADKEDVGNTIPDVEFLVEEGIRIPILTPFELKAEGFDAEGDDMTYCFEQWDKGPLSDIGSPQALSPLFKSVNPHPEPVRRIPGISGLNADNFSLTEFLPDYTRDISFRVTVRDNNPEVGGASWDYVKFRTDSTSGPFKLLYPSSFQIFEVGQDIEIQWDVANTTNDIVNCQKVDIYLSTTGGTDFPYPLAINVDNDGSEMIKLPNRITNKARFMVKANENIFFDISNQNLRVTGLSSPGYVLDIEDKFKPDFCLPGVLEYNLNLTAYQSFDAPVLLEIVNPDEIPTGININIADTTVDPDGATKIDVEMIDFNEDSQFNIVLRAVAEGTDTNYYHIPITTLGNDFSDLVLIGPEEGANGQPESPLFEWEAAQYADIYLIEIADEPSFSDSSIIFSAETADESWSPIYLLDKGKYYFWRVSAINECGIFFTGEIRSFHTQTLRCETYLPNDLPINISQSGTPTIESLINVNEDGILTDVNILELDGSHNYIGDLDVRLVSAEGTKVILFKNKCANLSGFDARFDDQASIEIQCPLTNPIPVKPEDPLAALNGEGTKGIWKMRIKDTQSGSGGKLKAWKLELCSSISIKSPALITNEVLFTNFSASAEIDAAHLEVLDDDNLPEELSYILVSLPKHGELLYNWENVSDIGFTFTQKDINDGKIRYRHGGEEDHLNDAFTFVVTDGVGGFLGQEIFNTEASEPTAVIESEITDQLINLYPNPSKDAFFVENENTESVEVIMLTDSRASSCNKSKVYLIASK